MLLALLALLALLWVAMRAWRWGGSSQARVRGPRPVYAVERAPPKPHNTVTVLSATHNRRRLVHGGVGTAGGITGRPLAPWTA